MSGELKKKQKELLGDVEVPCVPDFKVADMQKTHFTELCFRLGAGYIYCHQVMLFKSFYSSTCIQAIAYTLTKSSLILLWHRKSFTCILSYFLDFLCGCLRYNVVPPTIILGFLLLIMRSITRILLRIDQQISPSFLWTIGTVPQICIIHIHLDHNAWMHRTRWIFHFHSLSPLHRLCLHAMI